MHALKTTITLVGLEKHSHLNGRVGRVVAQLMVSGKLSRYLVKVQGEKRNICVHSTNVIRLGLFGAAASALGFPDSVIELIENTFPNL